MSRIKLVVGLGNPGAKYENTRHNVGFWFVDSIAQAKGATLSKESKFQGECCKLEYSGDVLWLIKPMNYMNNSGQAVRAIANFYKFQPQEILVVHDELDLPPGAIRLKQGGGHGGHNGLRDIQDNLNSRDYYRLRIGIGHPGHSHEVTNHVLGVPSKSDFELITNAINDGLNELPMIVVGESQKAMHCLHSRKL